MEYFFTILTINWSIIILVQIFIFEVKLYILYTSGILQ